MKVLRSAFVRRICSPSMHNLMLAISLLVVFYAALPAPAETCTTQSQMKAPDRNLLEQTARALSAQVIAADEKGMQSGSSRQLTQSFQGVSASIAAVSPKLKGAQITVEDLYLLEASTKLPEGEAAQFFCGAFNTPAHVTFTLPGLAPGKYALAMVHATGIAEPQQMTFVFFEESGWKLAGFIVKPMTAAGQDGLWYWRKARDLQTKKQSWNACLYYQTAAELLSPVEFVSSGNLEKLLAEQQQARPKDWPSVESPLILPVNGRRESVKLLLTDESVAGPGLAPALDLVVRYDVADLRDAAATTKRNQEMIGAMVAKIPELREAFQGITARAVSPQGTDFGTEMAMKDIH